MWDSRCLNNEEARRVFWTTMDSCGRYNVCGVECSIAGLQYIDTPEGRTISNADWVKSLILNILNTRARSDLKCPTPAGTYGHWSESYRDDGLYVGTRLYDVAEKTYTRVLDGVKAISAAIRSDVGKLIILGLAQDIQVDAVYRGRSRVDVTITLLTRSTPQIINFSGIYTTDTWVWN